MDILETIDLKRNPAHYWWQKHQNTYAYSLYCICHNKVRIKTTTPFLFNRRPLTESLKKTRHFQNQARISIWDQPHYPITWQNQPHLNLDTNRAEPTWIYQSIRRPYLGPIMSPIKLCTQTSLAVLNWFTLVKTDPSENYTIIFWLVKNGMTRNPKIWLDKPIQQLPGHQLHHLYWRGHSYPFLFWLNSLRPRVV